MGKVDTSLSQPESSDKKNLKGMMFFLKLSILMGFILILSEIDVLTLSQGDFKIANVFLFIGGIGVMVFGFRFAFGTRS
ncbi:hypothetical protein EVJ32_10925 [Exiguobacterium sp. SH5S4]|uniref:hypothetical protein n=1 Tax=Exiguobacterium sp. SH5S4 TaxID=2510961 RepID=UPI00103B5009|nr:hypothetical protein [Exiguobacterium sp. SH5S4]TCI25304.1 hypothetical protein EVJ32_10925 [Exiguobacterium sp. SH5S4]